METTVPNPDRHEAAAALAGVADVRRAVRDRPWPVWLYPTNALLLGGLALAGLVQSSMLGSLIVLALGTAIAALNYWAGRLIGTPFAIPTNRGFRILAALSAVFVIASLFARAADLGWAIVACAAAATVSYSVGSVLHRRSTHR